MPNPSSTDFDKVLALLREGRTQDADDLVLQLRAEAAEVERIAAGLPLEPPPPREPDVIILDYLETVGSLLGNHPQLVALAEEYKAATPQPK